MIRYTLWIIPIVIVACTGGPAEKTVEAPELWGLLEPGPHGVGYTVVEHIDSTRTVRNTDNKRPIQVTIWYPASSPFNAGANRYRNYYLLTVSQTNFNSPTAEEEDAAVERYISFMNSNEIPDTAAREWLSRPMAGMREAEPATGTFPLVLIAQGNFHSAYNQAILSEYLASHGYIVATTPSVSLIDGPLEETDQIYDYADTQAYDLQEAISATERRFEIRFDRIAVVGHSFGARAGFLLALRRHTNAFVSLDGGIANRQGKEWLDRIEFDPESWTTPMLHLYQEVDSIVEPDFELLDTLSPVKPVAVRVDSVPHAGFTSLGFVAGTVPGFAIGQPADDIGGRAAEIAEATRRFLDDILKNKGSEKQGLDTRRWKYLNTVRTQ